MDEQKQVLRVEGISKSYPGVQALDKVSMSANSGEILAMVGENGAGKSTLIQVLSGATHADEGEIYLAGQRVRFSHPHEAERAGIATVYQELSLVNNLTVAENIFAGRQQVGPFGLMNTRAMNRAAQALLDQFQVEFEPGDRVSSLSLGNQQLVEIMKALSGNAKVLILDEPTSSLSLQEANILFDLLRRLRDQNMAIIYVSHHLEEVFAISDRVFVLRDGEAVGSRLTTEVDETEVVNMMVGRELEAWETGASCSLENEVLQVEGLTREGVFENVSFGLCAGEVLTFFGLVGAGRTEMARALIGMDPYTSGTVRVNGEAVSITHPSQAKRHGLAYLSEDRKKEGLFLTKSIKENFLVTNLRKVTPGGMLNWPALEALAETYVDKLSIRTPSLDQLLRNLSGGNQQKVLLGIWLATEPEVLIVDEPTRGIDVGTKREIHRQLRELARQGKAIIAISSDLPEALAISDRIAVMRQGRLEGFVSQAEATQENVMELAAGVSQKEKTK
jgi:ribose transport system ATP-binding protein